MAGVVDSRQGGVSQSGVMGTEGKMAVTDIVWLSIWLMQEHFFCTANPRYIYLTGIMRYHAAPWAISTCLFSGNVQKTRNEKLKCRMDVFEKAMWNLSVYDLLKSF